MIVCARGCVSADACRERAGAACIWARAWAVRVEDPPQDEPDRGEGPLPDDEPVLGERVHERWLDGLG